MLPDWIERVRHCVYRRGMTDLDRDRIMQDFMSEASDAIEGEANSTLTPMSKSARFIEVSFSKM